jgi:rRNA processing protein Krr1/Pno1
MFKTKDPVSIPLIDKAVKLIGEGFKAQKVFRVPTNQVADRENYIQLHLTHIN